MKTLYAAVFCILNACQLSNSALAQTQEAYSKVMNHPIRSSADLKADESRLPIEFLTFAKVKPGDQVLDLASGGGYTAQLLALATQPGGKLWAQNDKPSAALSSRLNQNPQSYIEVLVKTFEDPIPENAPALDLITIVLSYHDVAFLPIDRHKMNQRIFKALKPGGHFVIIDHSAKNSTGLQDIKTIHRIDEQTVINDFTSVGFLLEAESGDWRNPLDPREELFSKMKQRDDRFALRFVKP
jgi:predicted methyltransferase